MASNPGDRCCTLGVKHEGVAKGELKNIGSISTYFSFPEDKSTEYCVLILPDVIGHDSINVELIADAFAAQGYFCVIPDLFSGDPVPLNRPEGFDLTKWRDGPPAKTPSTIDPIVTSVIKELRTTYNVKKIGAVGYCFGGKYVARFLGDIGSQNNAIVDAGYAAHPSFVDEEELQAIKGPLSIAAAETDHIFSAEKRHRSEEILKELSQGPHSVPYQLNLYSHVSHGFAVRADLSIKSAKFAKEAAFTQAVHWFDFCLKGGNLN